MKVGNRALQGWLIAEVAVLSTGTYAATMWAILALRGLPYLIDLYVIILSSIIFGMAWISRFIWLRGEKLSGGAYGAGIVLCCYSWLQLTIPWMGFGWGGVRFALLEIYLAAAICLIRYGGRGTTSSSPHNRDLLRRPVSEKQ